MRVLLVGATGAFGSRLAARLAGIAGLELVLAARSKPALASLHAALAPHAAASLSTAIVDRRRPDLSHLAPDIVIDAAGPFQDGDLGLARAAIEAGAHVIDLADARVYVAAFPAALDDAARARSVLAVTGASSTPALSHAVLDDLVAGWSRVDRIVVAILPGARAPRGLSVIQAILSWVGHPVRVFVGGDWRERPGWSGLRRLTVPGLGRWFASLCETPDLDLLPSRFAVRDEALFLAGLEVPVMHLGLWLLSFPVRLHLVSDLRPLAGLLRAVAGPLASLGSDAGGMVVEASGLDGDGRRALEPRRAPRMWTRHSGCRSGGPRAGTPPGSIEANRRHRLRRPARLRGDPRGIGGIADRDAYRKRVAERPRFVSPPARPRLRGAAGRRALDSWAGWPIRRPSRDSRWARSRGARPTTPPGPAGIGPDRHPRGHRACRGRRDLTRSFGTRALRSRLVDVHEFGTFEERFGPLAIRFCLTTHSCGVEWRFAGWRIGPVVLPRRLGPRVLARGEERGGLYGFTVVVAHPLVGLVVAYRGTLDPASCAPQPGAGSRAKDGSDPM